MRDRWKFNSEVQFLSNRGYAVLQINYRGSTGFGRDFFTAAFREIGRKMQDDLSDAVLWAIDQGITKRDQVAIYGRDFGGYLAIAGGVITPELYRCIIVSGGIFDWVQYFQSDFGEVVRSRVQYTAEWFGEEEQEQVENLAAVSPINLVDRLEAPVLLIHRRSESVFEDPQSQRMASVLRTAGKRFEEYVEGEERRSFLEPNGRPAYYRRIESFLDEHLR